MQNENEMVLAWQEAADDLGIAVNSPYIVECQAFPVYVRSFGRPAGALPLLIGDDRPRRAAEEKGFYFSFLNPDLYCKYDRPLYTETLLEWGWFGAPELAPKWYVDGVFRLTGKSVRTRDL